MSQFFYLWIILKLPFFLTYMLQCLSYISLKQRRESLEAFQTFWSRGRMRRMGRRLRRMRMTRRRWRGRGGMRKICRTALYWRSAWYSNFPWYILPLLQHLLQGSFQQDKVKQLLCSDTQRPNIMNYLVTPEAPDHLPLATLPFARTV